MSYARITNGQYSMCSQFCQAPIWKVPFTFGVAALFSDLLLK